MHARRICDPVIVSIKLPNAWSAKPVNNELNAGE